MNTIEKIRGMLFVIGHLANGLSDTDKTKRFTGLTDEEDGKQLETTLAKLSDVYVDLADYMNGCDMVSEEDISITEPIISVCLPNPFESLNDLPQPERF